MASRLVGLQRQLAWRDFGAPRPGPTPPPGTTATAAQTRARPNRTVFAEHVPGTRPPEFRLRDSVTVSVEIDTSNTWVMNWVFSQPTTFQDSLLHHEQGHYDMVALFCRDMFIELMALKDQTFSQAADVMTAVQAIYTRYDAFIANVHAPYDAAAQHGRVPAQQTRWDGFIQTAFTQARNPPVNAPDGTPYKVQLADCLRNAGIQI